MLGNALGSSAGQVSAIEAKLQALTTATQEALEKRLQSSQEATAAQLLALTARQTAVDAKMDSLESKLDSILAKLSAKDKESAKFGTILNPFNTTAAAPAGGGKEN
jgi:chromosome segregation ATPase